jgi:hypothetical protein
LLAFWSDNEIKRHDNLRISSNEAETARAVESAAQASLRASEADARAAEANQKAEEERLARIKIEARIAPRSMPQAQQHELTAKLAGLPKQQGTVIASPSTPESELFARVLTASLTAAGWEMEILPGTATATVLHPTGVIIQWPLDATHDNINDQGERSKAATVLADGLNALGIDATALPWPIQPPHTIAILVSAK